MPDLGRRSPSSANRRHHIYWLCGIFSVTVAVEVALFFSHKIDAPIWRLACTLLLFVLTTKGYRWARYLLASAYGIGGIVVFVAALSGGAPSSTRLSLIVIGVFSLVSSAFFLRSEALRMRSKLLEGGD